MIITFIGALAGACTGGGPDGLRFEFKYLLCMVDHVY